jgi:hypothetical protein
MPREHRAGALPSELGERRLLTTGAATRMPMASMMMVPTFMKVDR